MNSKNVLTFIFFFLAFNLNSWAESYSMRHCALLPVVDTIDNAIAYKIYEKLERNLKNSKWCKYKTTSDMISIFSKYRDNLETHLQNEQVLRVVAQKLQVGTLIRISVKNEAEKILVQMDVIGEDGDVTYFSEKTLVEKPDTILISQTLINWLEVYEASIPYDGKVLGVLGEQVNFSLENTDKYSVGQEFEIKKSLRQKRHPLLKKIVAWDTKVIAKGKVVSISKNQCLGIINVYYSKGNAIETGDWVTLNKITKAQKIIDKRSFPKMNDYKFGKLGEFQLSFNLSDATVATSLGTSNNIKMSNYIFGITAEVEMWITREYFAMGEFSRRIGTLKKKAGSPSSGSPSYTNGSFKIGGGYKYLPLGFFYGPQINVYGGWAKYSYNLELSGSDGFGENSIGGLMLGVKGDMPIDKGLRAFAKGEFIPFPRFEDVSGIFGGTKSISSMVLEFGVKYKLNPMTKLIGSMELMNNSAKFKSGNIAEVNYKNTIIKFGGNFTF